MKDSSKLIDSEALRRLTWLTKRKMRLIAKPSSKKKLKKKPEKKKNSKKRKKKFFVNVWPEKKRKLRNLKISKKMSFARIRMLTSKLKSLAKNKLQRSKLMRNNWLSLRMNLQTDLFLLSKLIKFVWQKKVTSKTS